jgi:hypothetical protein
MRGRRHGRKLNPKVMGAVFLAFAVAIAFAPFPELAASGRRWMALVIAGVFALAGLQILIAAKGRLGAFLGGLVCLGLCSIGTSIAFGPDKLGGGIPLIPKTWNQTFGHVLFGAGALMTGAIAVWFFAKALRRR